MSTTGKVFNRRQSVCSNTIFYSTICSTGKINGDRLGVIGIVSGIKAISALNFISPLTPFKGIVTVSTNQSVIAIIASENIIIITTIDGIDLIITNKGVYLVSTNNIFNANKGISITCPFFYLVLGNRQVNLNAAGVTAITDSVSSNGVGATIQVAP